MYVIIEKINIIAGASLMLVVLKEASLDISKIRLFLLVMSSSGKDPKNRITMSNKTAEEIPKIL